jgi:CDGSH-type Zn-finger protein
MLVSGIRIDPEEKSMADMTDISVFPNGPLRISGDFVIKDPQGRSFDLAGRTAISLCRCGHSENKPFCDGSHARNGFQSVVEARVLPPPAPKP